MKRLIVLLILLTAPVTAHAADARNDFEQARRNRLPYVSRLEIFADRGAHAKTECTTPDSVSAWQRRYEDVYDIRRKGETHRLEVTAVLCSGNKQDRKTGRWNGQEGADLTLAATVDGKETYRVIKPQADGFFLHDGQLFIEEQQCCGGGHYYHLYDALTGQEIKSGVRIDGPAD